MLHASQVRSMSHEHDQKTLYGFLVREFQCYWLPRPSLSTKRGRIRLPESAADKPYLDPDNSACDEESTVTGLISREMISAKGHCPIREWRNVPLKLGSQRARTFL